MTFNWSTFLLQSLNFIVLAYVLHRLLYRPIRKAIELRRESVARAQHDADKIRQEAVDLQQSLQKQLADMERLREETIRTDREQIDKDRQTLLADAHAAAQKRRREFEESLERERDQMLTDVRAEVVGQAVDLAKRLLCQAADRTLHRQLCLRVVEAINELPPPDRERIRQSWQADEGVELETARELDKETLEQVASAVVAMLGQAVSPTVRERPALLEGARLRIGGQVWDGSLISQLPEADRIVRTDGKR